MNVLFTTSTKVPTSLLMTATKNARKRKDKHFCSHIWERPRLNIYKKRRESQDFCSWQQPKKIKKRKSQHFCSWRQKKEEKNINLVAHDSKKRKKEKVQPFLLMRAKKEKKRKSQHFWLWQQQIWKHLNEIFGSVQRIWEKKLQPFFLTQNNIYTRRREEKSEELVAISSWVVLILSPSTLHLVTIILQQCQDICLQALP